MNNNDDISKSLQQELKEKRVQNSQWASYEYNLARFFALLATVGSFATS